MALAASFGSWRQCRADAVIAEGDVLDALQAMASSDEAHDCRDKTWMIRRSLAAPA
jgi:hypothetical protein